MFILCDITSLDNRKMERKNSGHVAPGSDARRNNAFHFSAADRRLYSVHSCHIRNLHLYAMDYLSSFVLDFVMKAEGWLKKTEQGLGR